MRAATLVTCSTVIACVIATTTRFAQFDQLVIFGDSYSSTYFRPRSTQPSPANPFGNIGELRTNGPKWPQYLATKYNESTILVYNMAFGGSTVDQAIVPSRTNGSFVKQLNRFLNVYSPSAVTKTPNTTLYAFWFGINDVGKLFDSNGTASDADVLASGLYTQIFDRYFSLLRRLRTEAGARNFLFINVPPLERTPIAQKAPKGPYNSRTTALVTSFNQRIAELAGKVQNEFAGSTVYTYDAHGMFDHALGEPGSFPELASVRDTADYCAAYRW
ncbi:uncharacterized protein B0I36DRAFT_367381 [Microdochium trichocladiopsis]|uniref:Carbohydrate esterase family 16 protein n=1 Tax=Microdochium trichocladiopsis TaxID=1682393 RepID=A0A9P9BHV1_9PEZI|nr:uncharacterized protein B0I36DRAFT_367381 [Microdochium trichocladiopsis]KAH7020905.1 hypothetical protein B0I36DRAFT_367381 [Microdochium trichocladiopsis]